MAKDNYLIGIDPGISGAVVVLKDGSMPVPVAWLRTPTMQEGKASRVDCAQLARFLRPYITGSVAIERVGAMPKQGVVSMFTFGHAAGAAQGVVCTMGIPMTLVTPQRWKSRAALIGKNKDAARSRAIQLWPTWAALGTKGEGQALADAALIALSLKRGTTR